MDRSVLLRNAALAVILVAVLLAMAAVTVMVWGIGRFVSAPDRWVIGDVKLQPVIVDEKESLLLKPGDALRIRVVSADVSVSDGEGDSIGCWFHGTVSTTSSDNVPHLKVNRSGNTVEVLVEWEDRPRRGAVRDDTNLEISLPRAYGGDLSARSVSGGIELESHDYSSLKLETVSGRIEAAGVSARTLNLDSTSGAIDISAQAGDVDARTVSGGVALDLRDAPARAAVETVSGSVRMEMPPAAAFSLDARSVSGSLSCGFPLEGPGSSAGPGQRSLRGKHGSSTAPITIRTVSGSADITPGAGA